ncbi:MAG TPA: DUF1993 domain-containing protein [Alphaproteobacteria bacterium]|jgi:hypothetical protein|nr:DUF1993 domain-containing protein [Alphaproteobacteria bacterium]
MAFSMYQASVPVFVKYLGGMTRVLDKAAPMIEARKIDPAVLAGLRLYPDMLPFNRQIQIASDNAKGPVARLAGIDIPKYEDTETTIAEFKARIAKTIAFVESVKPAQLEGSEDRTVVIPVGQGKLEFKGADYLTTFALPNFFFHVTTAYNILRHIGVEIGKRDYMNR